MARQAKTSGSLTKFKICKAGFSDSYRHLVDDILVEFKNGKYSTSNADVIKALKSARYCEEIK